jgi:hypothetical protein
VAVPRRQVHRPDLQPADRVLLTALSRSVYGPDLAADALRRAFAAG